MERSEVAEAENKGKWRTGERAQQTNEEKDGLE